MRRPLAALALALAVSSCAPLALTRTPQPLEAGRTRASIGLAYGFNLSGPPACETPPNRCPFEGVFVPYVPLQAPFTVDIATGLDGQTDLTFSIMLSASPGLRVGGKTLVLGGPVLVAVDYGASIFFISNLGADLGLIVSVPLEGGEPYLAARGLGSYYYGDGFYLNLAGTFGTRLSLGGSDLFLELTLATTRDTSLGQSSTPRPQRTGFILVPAIAFRF